MFIFGVVCVYTHLDYLRKKVLCITQKRAASLINSYVDAIQRITEQGNNNMKKKKEPTFTELMDAALTQVAEVKTIAAEMKMLLKLRTIAHQKMRSRLHERVVRTK